MVTTELERIKIGKLQDQNGKDEYVERLKDSFSKIKQYEYLELDELWKVMKSVLVDEPRKVCGVNKRTNVNKKDNEWWNFEIGYKMLKVRNKDAKMRAKEYVKRRKNDIKERYDKRFSDDFRENQQPFWHMVKKTRKNPETSCKHDTVADDNVTATEYTIDDGNESGITMDEIVKALKRRRIGKAAGYDRVSSEMLMSGGGIVASLLCHLFN
ncbi:hypothetical protein EVAR_42097_1 [Eumeta japonica]|uniref:Uncharacterized protein n=1 Tax=Eumeta variegata TaxID=151549 RepID=A0A4C1XGP5_EUMVA|nr:hypothetical protein EVAR_42097_1 [Eumeta japonica]